MDHEEAQAWLRGERSTVNYAGGDNPQDAQERATRMDAAMTEQAYWVVRAQSLESMERKAPKVVEAILVGLLIAIVLMAVVVYFQL